MRAKKESRIVELLLNQQHEHLELLAQGYLEELTFVTRKEPRFELMQELFRAALAALKEHSTYEESILAQTSYPLLKAHKIEHQNMLNYLEVQLKQLSGGGNFALEKVVATFQQQLKSHTTCFDDAYLPYLKELDTAESSPKKKTP